jgi:protein gp37
MSEKTNIAWTDSTFNPWIGCTKVSPGCANCYAEHDTPARVFGVKWGKGQPRHRTSAGNWRKPVAWNKKPFICDTCGEAVADMSRHTDEHGEDTNGNRHEEFHRRRVFCGSLCDWLDDEVPIVWLLGTLWTIYQTKDLVYLMLSKRPQLWRKRVNATWKHSQEGLQNSVGFERREWDQNDEFRKWLQRWLEEGEAPQNVWIGTTVEDRERKSRIDDLRRIPAAKRFLSLEPLLEDLGELNLEGIDWVIVGGESGKDARPCNVDWLRDIVRQCRAAGVPVFVKQLGSYPVTDNANAQDWPDEIEFETVPGMDGFAAGRAILQHPKGGNMEEFPADLRVRDF